MYPTTTDLSAYLTALGMTVPGEPVLELALGEAIEIFERASGRSFDQTEELAERTYDGIGNVGKRIVIAIDDCYELDSVAVGETELTTDQYRVLPKLAGTDKPVEAIEFLDCVPRGVDIITINAKYGWPVTPPLVSRSILKLAVVRVPQSTSNEVTGPIQSRKIGDRSISYGTTSSGSTGFQAGHGAETESIKAATSYRRIPYA